MLFLMRLSAFNVFILAVNCIRFFLFRLRLLLVRFLEVFGLIVSSLVVKIIFSLTSFLFLFSTSINPSSSTLIFFLFDLLMSPTKESLFSSLSSS